jgi:hypothetical protein
VPATAHGRRLAAEYAQVLTPEPTSDKAGSLAAASAALSHRPIEDLQPERALWIFLNSMTSVSSVGRGAVLAYTSRLSAAVGHP